MQKETKERISVRCVRNVSKKHDRCVFEIWVSGMCYNGSVASQKHDTCVRKHVIGVLQTCQFCVRYVSGMRQKHVKRVLENLSIVCQKRVRCVRNVSVVLEACQVCYKRVRWVRSVSGLLETFELETCHMYVSYISRIVYISI